MHRLLILVAFSSFTTMTGVACGGGPAAVHRGPGTYQLRMVIVGDEDSDPQADLSAGRCSTSTNSVVQGCWTWSATQLGHGTYTIAHPTFQGLHLVWTFTCTDEDGDTLAGTVTDNFIPDPSQLDAVTHANRYPASFAITGGTGRFASATGLLLNTATTTVVSVNSQTHIAHTRVTTTAVGSVTL
jgi:hypothetical protein